MIVDLGLLGLTGAFLAACFAVATSIAARQYNSAPILQWSRRGLYAVSGFLGLSAICLIWAILDNQFRLAYVAEYSERSLPLAYKIAAFWAGQDGSLLLWSGMIAGFSALCVAWRRKEPLATEAPAITVLAVVCAFFSLLMLWAADPFRTLPMTPQDGGGLNPMLQHPWMVLHPPALFLGYAAFTIPFAYALGAMVAGRSDNQWVDQLRRWALVAWIFLTIGIVLGAKWAYVELGWGGYWKWDPVENASLLPWLTGTAMLHSMIAHARRGMLKAWSVLLMLVTFLLCIFGTYLTRSNLVASVHTFSDSPVSMFFLCFLAVCVAIPLTILIWRRGLLKSDRALERLASLEGVFLGAIVLLILMTLLTLVGTLYPVLSFWFFGQQVTLETEFYTTAVLPLALVLVALMGLAPAFSSAVQIGRVARKLLPALLAAVLAGMGAVLAGGWSAWMICASAVMAFVIVAILSDFFASMIRASRGDDTVAMVGVLRANTRRYGAHLAHAGMSLLVLGVAGSSLFGVSHSLELKTGQSATIAGQTLQLKSLTELPASSSETMNYNAVEAQVVLSQAGQETETLTPQVRYYKKKPDQPNREVAIHSSLVRDTYMILAGWKDGGQTCTLEVLVNPLVSWIWIGSCLLMIGAAVAALANRRAKVQSETTMDVSEPEIRPAAPATASFAAGKAKGFLLAMVLSVLAASAAQAQTKPAATDETWEQLKQEFSHSQAASAPGSLMTNRSAGGSLVIQAVQGTQGGPKIQGDQVIVELFSQNGRPQRMNKKLDEQGALTLDNLPLLEPIQPRVTIVHRQGVYQAIGDPIEIAKPHQKMSITVYELADKRPPLTFPMRHLMINGSSNHLEVMEMLSIQNPTDRAWGGAAKGEGETLVISLPQGAHNVQAMGPIAESIVVKGDKLVCALPLTPGVTNLRLGYQLPAKDGAARVVIRPELPMEHMMVFLSPQQAQLEATGLTPAETKEVHGRPMRSFTGPALAAGEELVLNLSSLPPAESEPEVAEAAAPRSNAPRTLIVVAGLGTLALCVGLVLRRRRPGATKGGEA